MYNLYRMASLAAKDTINPEEEMDDDEENKAFEIDVNSSCRRNFY